MDLRLTGKRAFVSGSTQGIGYAIARQLLQEGVAVIINGRTSEKTAHAVMRLQQYGNVSGVAADLQYPDRWSNCWQVCRRSIS